MKKVCIVGAGPAGLTAARSFLHHAPRGVPIFDVTIFDKQDRIGGLWPDTKDDQRGLLHPLMVANQSRHSVQFSDLAWPDNAPQFPRAWQVGRYLERYRRRYCENATLRLNTRVEKAEPLRPPAAAGSGVADSHSGAGAGDSGAAEAAAAAASGSAGWKVWTRTAVKDELGKWNWAQELEEHTFDYLLVASGFFGEPIIPEAVRAANPDPHRITRVHGFPIIHSSKYRNLSNLLGATTRGGKILVVGNQLSGVEIAGTIAMHLSAATNSPGPALMHGPLDKVTVHHIIQRPTWVIPLYTSPKPWLKGGFVLPVDIPSYNLSLRPQPMTNTQGHISAEAAGIFHGIYRECVGTDQADINPLLAVRGTDLEQPPYLALSDWYMEFVRSGMIQVSRGKLTGVGKDRVAHIRPLSDVSSEDSGSHHQVGDIEAIVLATGFTGSPSLKFLPADVQQAISFEPDDISTHVALAFHGTYHPAVPNLGFVGFYRSPYWGVMEMQGRFLATLWGCEAEGIPQPPCLAAALKADTSIARTLALRESPGRAAQFPMGDYPWLMQEFAAALGLERRPHLLPMPLLRPEQPRMDVLTPARYLYVPPGADEDAARQIGLQLQLSMRQLENATLEATRGAFVTSAVFRALLGEWRINRCIKSRNDHLPSGHFTGVARFSLRDSTADKRAPKPADGGAAEDEEDSAVEELEYLYHEHGQFTPKSTLPGAQGGASWRSERRWVWRLDERAGHLHVLFVKDDNHLQARALYHTLRFAPFDRTQDLGWGASAGHECAPDDYSSLYEFNFRGVYLEMWRVHTIVTGPVKDYKIFDTFTRGLCAPSD